MLLAVPSLVIVGWGFVVRRRPPARSVSAPFLDDPGSRRDTREARPEGDIAIVGLAWFLGTFVPFVLLSVLYSRTSYLYYMIVVMPGIYLTVTYVLYRARRYRKLIVLWAGTVLAAAIVMYPLTPIPLP